MENADLISAYIKLRDRRAQRKAEYETDDASDKGNMEKIESILLKRLNAEGLTSFSCRGVGTAYTKTQTSVTTADGEVFMEFCQSHNLMHLMEKRPAKKAVEEYVAENQELPPGIKMSRRTIVNIERS